MIGVDDSGTIVGTRATFKEDAKSWIFEKTGQKIEIEEIETSD